MPTEIIDVHGHLPPGADESDIEKIILSQRANGVGKVFVSSLGRDTWVAFPDEKHVADANEDTFRLCEKHPDAFRGYVYLNPNHDSWEQELDKWASNRFFIGVKLWVSLKDDDGSSDICLPVLNRAAEDKFPILFHSCFRHGGELKGELNAVEIARLGKKVPAATIIMAHLGGAWEKALKAIADQPNVYTDVSGFPATRGAVECAVRHCGRQRVLFGADIPCRTFQSQLQKVYAADIPDDAKEDILRNNAPSIFAI